MPIPIYSLVLIGRDFGNQGFPFEKKEEADKLYNSIDESIKSDSKFVEISVNQESAQIRTDSITAFGVNVTFRETKEEIEERRRKEIEHRLSYENSPVCADSYSGRQLLSGHVGSALGRIG